MFIWNNLITPDGSITVRAFDSTGTAINVAVAASQVVGTNSYYISRAGLGLSDDDSGYVVWYDNAVSLADSGGMEEFSSVLNVTDISTELFDTAAVDTGWSLRQALRVILAVLAGKLSGGGTSTTTIRDVADTKDRIVATVDSEGNRTSITYDKS